MSKDEDEGIEEAVMLGGSLTRSQEEIGGGDCRLRGRRSGWRGLVVALEVVALQEGARGHPSMRRPR